MEKIVIAHRGACGYLPEHTLAAKTLAHGMGAHYLEQDVVLSRDNIPLVLHDIYLDATTDVADHFPDRAREDGRYYAIDFDLAEIKKLGVHERSTMQANGTRRAVYPGRFPPEYAQFKVPTLAEEIDLLAGLDKSTGRRTGLYVELKAPNWHLAQCVDLAAAVMTVLAEKDYAEKKDQVYLQCFDDKTLKHLRNEVGTPLPLVQLIGENIWREDSDVDYDYLRTKEGLRYIASYADGIGPWIPHIYEGKDTDSQPRISNLTTDAHEQGLLVHPYTFRRDDLPQDIETPAELHDILFAHAGVDGLFSDFPDISVHYLLGNGA